MTDDTKRIEIDTVLGGSLRDQQALMRNYFMATSVNDTYQFFTPNGELIPTTPVVVGTGVDFSFFLRDMPRVIWTIKDFHVEGEHARGNWTNTDQTEAEEGSFQAQSGAGAEEGSSAATA